MHPNLLSCAIALLLNRALASPESHSRWRAERPDTATGDARQMSTEPLILPDEFIRRSGGALPVAALRRSGLDGAPIRAGLRAGRLISVRRGWYAIPDAPADVIRAVRVGGVLTAASAARLRNLWMLDDPLLHVRVPSSASGLRSPDDATVALDRSAHGVCVHYRTAAASPAAAAAPGDRPASDGLARSIAEMFRCAGTVPAMIALESALNRRELPIHAIESVRRLVPSWAHRPLRLATPDSDSGLETIARLLFHRLRVRVRTQVLVPGVRHVDLLIGDRLVIELDGRAFHSGEDFERDRRQDLELALRGYLVIRLSYRMVVHDWDATHRAVLEVVARGQHRWGRVSRELPEFGVVNSGEWARSGL